MRTATRPTVAGLLAFTLLQPLSYVAFAQGLPNGPLNPPANSSSGPQTTAARPQEPDSSKAPSSKFALQDGTAVKLRLNRNVSSADATVGESVDFEVLEEIAIDGYVVVPKGGTAIGTVTEAVPKRRMGRAGKLEIVLDYVRLSDKEKAAVRAVKDVKGGSHTVGMTVGIVATGLLFWPAAPFFLFMHGKDITIPKGAEVTAYVNGDQRLSAANFLREGEDIVQLSAPPDSAPAVSQAPAALAAPPAIGSYEIQSDPQSAEVYVDGAFIGNTPATLKLRPGQRNIRVALTGYKDWSRDLT